MLNVGVCETRKFEFEFISFSNSTRTYFEQTRTVRVSNLGSKLNFRYKARAKHLPCLAKVARSLLAIPATSVNSERLNSTSGNIVSVKRSSLLSEHVEELTFLNKNLL